MNFLTEEQYNRKAISPYWMRAKVARWQYMSRVIKLAKALNPTTVLEIGCADMPLCVGSDIMDISKAYQATTLIHDAGNVPWPIEDKKYDLVIALQVWEHITDRQEAAFAEVMRVANHAILSFPYMWNCPADKTHHEISSEKIAKWTLTIPPVRTIMCGDAATLQRVIYQFDFTQGNKI